MLTSSSENYVSAFGKKIATKKSKRAKDRPKRPLSAYNFFFASERQRLLHEGFLKGSPPNNFTRLAKKIGREWKTLPDSEKAVFQIQAEHEQKRYRNSLEEWKLAKEKAEIAASNNSNAKEVKDADNSFFDVATLSRQNTSNTFMSNFFSSNGNCVDPLNNPSNPSFCILAAQLDNEDTNYLLNLRDI